MERSDVASNRANRCSAGQIWVYDFSKRLEQESNDRIIPYLDYAFFSYDQDDSYIRDFMVNVREKGAAEHT